MVQNEPFTLEKLEKLMENITPYLKRHTKVKMNIRYFNHLVLVGAIIIDTETQPCFTGIPIEFDNSVDTYEFE